MLADRAQPLSGQALLGMKREHGGAAVVGNGIVSRASKPRGAAAVLDGLLRLPRDGAARRELAEPAGQHRPELTPRRYAEETVALAELTVLVAAAGHERLGKSERADVEGHDVEMVIGVDEQRHAVT